MHVLFGVYWSHSPAAKCDRPVVRPSTYQAKISSRYLLSLDMFESNDKRYRDPFFMAGQSTSRTSDSALDTLTSSVEGDRPCIAS